MDELRRHLSLLIAARQKLATVIVRENRRYSEAELRLLGELATAIQAVERTIGELDPAPPQSRANPDYRLVALETYRANQQLMHHTAQLQGQYGFWLITSLAAAHVAAIYLIANLDGLMEEAKTGSIWVHLIGVILAFTAGLTTWVNWSLAVVSHARWLNADVLVDPSAWPKQNKRLTRSIKGTMWLAIVLGIASLIALFIGAKVVLNSL